MGTTRLSKPEIDRIRRMIESGVSNAVIRGKTGVTQQQVAAVKAHMTLGRYGEPRTPPSPDAPEPVSSGAALDSNVPPAMRALSIRQPWVELILRGEKDVENRGWRTHRRGPLLIHASKTPDREGMEEHGFSDLPTGSILGVVDVVDCTQDVRSRWHSSGSWGWYLVNPRRFATPIPFKGAVGLMSVPPSLVEEAFENIKVRRRNNSVRSRP